MLPEAPRGLDCISAVVFDFDGVFTDNKVFVFEDGREAVCCSRADGVGLARLGQHEIDALILSQECNPVVGARAHKLGIEVIQGCDDKRAALLALVEQRQWSLTNMAYLGNDVNDLGCLQLVGLPACVADAVDEVKAVCRYHTQRCGGDGAVREFCDKIVAARVEHVGRMVT